MSAENTTQKCTNHRSHNHAATSMRPYSSNLSIFALPHSIAESKNAMQMPLLRGDFGGERVNGGRNKASAFTGKRILTENVGPRTCLPVFHKLSTAIRGIPASMVKNTLRVLRQRRRVCTSFCFALTKKMQHFLLFAGRGMLARGTLVG